MKKRRFMERLFNVASEPQTTSVRLASNDTDKAGLFLNIGRDGEKVAEKLGHLAIQLSSLQTLSDEFRHVLDPVNEFLLAHSGAQTRLSELEALLSRDRQQNGDLRRQLESAAGRLAAVEDQLATDQRQLVVVRTELEAKDADIEQSKAASNELASKLLTAERTLKAEVQKAEGLNDAQRGLKRDLGAIEQELLAEQSKSAALRDALSTAETEVDRLKTLVGRIQPELFRADRQISELERDLQTTREALAASDVRSNNLLDERSATESAHTHDMSVLRDENMSLRTRCESFESRLASSLSSLELARQSLAEQREHGRHRERNLKDALEARADAERSASTLAEDNHRLLKECEVLTKSQNDARSRCDMLAKAVAAKDNVVDEGQYKIASLTNQLAELMQRLDRDRADHEAASRKLVEEVQAEKAERALAQGALMIARASREKLLSEAQRAGSNTSLPTSHGDLDLRMDNGSDAKVREFRPSGVRE